MGSKISSESVEGSSAASAVKSAQIMVNSNSSTLSWFDYPVDRQNRGTVVEYLKDLRLPIIAVWVVARPINRKRSGSFEHWCVKIQAKGALISIDFLEHCGKGAFGLQQHPDIGVQLDDFLVYKVTDKDTKVSTRVKWEIVSSVTPSPLKKRYYFDYLSDHERLKLHEFMKNSKLSENDPNKFLKDIKCNKNVSEIAKFCRMWYAKDKGKGYNAITKNCQQFAAELYRYLVGENYPQKTKLVFDRYQSPYDQKQWKIEQQRAQKASRQKPPSSPDSGSSPSPTPPLKHSKRKPKKDAEAGKKEKRKKIDRDREHSNSRSESRDSSHSRNSRRRRSKQTEEFYLNPPVDHNETPPNSQN